MTRILFALLGRASLVLEPLRGLFARRVPVRTQAGSRAGEDKTGLVLAPDSAAVLLPNAYGLRIARFSSVAHTFWRAQELTLLVGRRDLLAEPCLDFGCGDGAFASALLGHAAIGADSDPEARAAAIARGTFDRVVGLDASGRLDLPDASVGSAFANSVLEHVDDLPAVLRDLRRVLAIDAPLLITAPTPGYTRHLRTYFGAAEADRINAQSAHRHLWAPVQWTSALASAGFAVDELLEYQPERFTFWYRMLRLVGQRGLGRFIPSLGERVLEQGGSRLHELIAQSVAGVQDGANVFIVARARPESDAP